MKEAFDNAFQEWKRVDHLFYVSLKYTRTVDMMKHVMERMISTLDFCMESLLKHAKESKLTGKVPSNPGLRHDLLKQLYPNDEAIINMLNLYMKLRKLLRASYTKREEYRRHVTMTATIDNNEIVEVNIDLLKEYYDQIKAFIFYTRAKAYGEEPA